MGFEVLESMRWITVVREHLVFDGDAGVCHDVVDGVGGCH
jgi:hypothetical protein